MECDKEAEINQGERYVYIGESSRGCYTRYKQELEDCNPRDKGFMFTHAMEKQGGDMDGEFRIQRHRIDGKPMGLWFVIMSLFVCVYCCRFVNGRDVVFMYLCKRLELWWYGSKILWGVWEKIQELDVKALYPSLKRKEVKKIIGEILEKAQNEGNICFKEVDFREVGKCLAIAFTKEEIDSNRQREILDRSK